MRKILLLIMSACLFASCSSDNEENEPDMEKEVTSVVVSNNFTEEIPYITIGHLKDGKFLLIDQFLTIKAGISTKEVNIEKDISNIYIFYGTYSLTPHLRIETSFKLKEGKNEFNLSPNKHIEVKDRNDATQYPQ